MTELVILAIIGGRQTAIAAEAVRSVIEVTEIVPVPRAPDYVLGLAALRSRPMTVIDTRQAIGLGKVDESTGNRAIVVEQDGHAYALMVEEVFDVVPTVGDIKAVGSRFGKGWQAVASGMVETPRGPALLIDPLALLAVDTRKAA